MQAQPSTNTEVSTTKSSSKADPLTEDDILNLAYEGVTFEETSQQQAKRIFEKHAVAAAQTLCNLAIFSDNERTRLQAATYVVERNLGRLQDNQPELTDDPFVALLADCVGDIQQPENQDANPNQ